MSIKPQNISEQLVNIYNLLLDHYGVQHWWPADGPFEIIAGAILTQMTVWSNVEQALDNLKAHGLLTTAALYRIPASDLANLIYSTGFYNSKTRKLKSFVNWLHDCYDDKLEDLFSLSISCLREELLSVHGIGEETADSIILYAAKKPIFVVDAYTRRIIDRIGLCSTESSYSCFQELFMRNIPADAKMYNEYHALLVRHGKEKCRVHPACCGCCLSVICARQIDIERE